MGSAKSTGLKKGLFISFEGVEGCGKTTQGKLLFKYLTGKGYKCVLTEEPGGTKLSQNIRDILLDKKNKNLSPIAELFLYIADRAQHTRELIIPELKMGKIVISDRFTDSTIAYQGGGRKIPLSTIKEMNRLATDGVMPNITILLDLPVKEGLARRKNKDRIELEGIRFHENVRNEYLKLANSEPKRIKIINGKSSIKETESTIRKHIDRCLSASGR